MARQLVDEEPVKNQESERRAEYVDINCII